MKYYSEMKKYAAQIPLPRKLGSKENMHKFTVMNGEGDGRFYFDPQSKEHVNTAQAVFNDLMQHGYQAAATAIDGTVEYTDTFNPSARETLFFRKLAGG